ncbi:YceI family protein [Burkholderiales bacterium]|nr:YceI family protein [Burkholderiales bacterium]
MRLAIGRASAAVLLVLGLGDAGGGTIAPSVVAAQSEIGFVCHQMGAPIAGSFRRFDAQVSFDAAEPQKGRFVISVDVSSVELPTADATREVVRPDWFDALRFPRAVFESTAIRVGQRGRYEIAGRLTIKGHVQDVVVPVALVQAGDLTIASGELIVRRLQFAIGEGEWNDPSLVADDVQIRFRLALAGVGPI